MQFRPAAMLLFGALTFVSTCRPAQPSGSTDRMLRVGFGIGKTARPASIGVLVDLLYAETLFRREWDGTNTPQLVSSWSWGDEGRTMRLELKRGVLFHDGTPLSAAVLVRHLTGLMATSERPATLGFGNVLAVAALENEVVEIKLSQPDAFLPSALGDIKITLPNAPDVGTGPFKLIAREDEVSTVRFDRYHGGRPAFRGVTIRTYDTQRSAWTALMRDEVDVVQEVSRDSVEFMQEAEGVRPYSVIQPFYIALVFNHRHPLLRNVELRHAISDGIDREEIVRVGMRGRGLPATGPIWPYHWAFDDPDAERTTYAPDAARRRLEAMALPSAAPAAGRPPSRLRLRCLVYSEDPQYERIALLAQRQLFKIGIDLDIELRTFGEVVKRIGLGEFDTYILPANASRTLERLYTLWHSDGPEGPAQLNSGYSGADRALDDLRASVDADDFRRNVQALIRRFDEEVPAAFIAWLEVTRAVSTEIDVANATDRDPFASLWQWRPAQHERHTR